MTSRSIHTEEFVELASIVFGSNWRVAASDALGVRRETLLLTLSVDGPVPDALAHAFVDLVEQKLEVDQRVMAEMARRIAELRRGLGDQPTSEDGSRSMERRRRSA